MKTIQSAIAILFLLITISCNKDETSNNDDTAKDYTSLKVDGTYMIDEEDGGGYISASDVASVSGDFDSKTFIMIINDVTAEGTYVLDASDDCSFTISPDIDGMYSLNHAGSHITAVFDVIEDGSPFKGIKGTFDGVLYNGNGGYITITEGEFEDLD